MRPGLFPGEILLHPAAAAALGLIVVNDLWLKRAHPGWWSGKLSDLGICFLLPLVVFAVLEWGAWTLSLVSRPVPAPGRWARAGSCLLSAAYFTAMQLVPAFASFHASVLAALTPGRGRLEIVSDPTDLIALGMTVLAWLVLRRRGEGLQGWPQPSQKDPANRGV